VTGDVRPGEARNGCVGDQDRFSDSARVSDAEFSAKLERRLTDPLPIVRYDAKAGERSLDVMRWGLIPYWAKDIKIGFSTINARAEEIDTKPAFREAFRQRRCLVPLDNFYEWVRREVVCMIVRRRHPAGPAVPSAVPYEVGRVGNNPSKSPRTMYPAVTTDTETARRRYFCQHQGG